MKLNFLFVSTFGAAMLLASSAVLAAHHVPKAPAAPASQAMQAAPKPVKIVDLNNASRAELKTLPGVGDAEADRIVKGRPYLSKANAFTNNVLPESAYAVLKDRIVVGEPKSPRLKAAVRQATSAGTKPVAAKP